MAWIPPLLHTQRLCLYDRCPSADQSSFQEGVPFHLQELSGLPDNWTICLKESDAPVGTAGFIRWERGQHIGEIGFILTSPHTGKGYMTEALKAILNFGFTKMGLLRIEAKSLSDNMASLGVLNRIGMQKVRQIQGRLSSKGPLVALEQYAIGYGVPYAP